MQPDVCWRCPASRSVLVAGRFLPFVCPLYWGSIISHLHCRFLQLRTRVEHRHGLCLRAAPEVSEAPSSGACATSQSQDPGAASVLGERGCKFAFLFPCIFSSMIWILIMSWFFNSFLKSKSFCLITMKMPSKTITLLLCVMKFCWILWAF